jgi:hypothetical protein
MAIHALWDDKYAFSVRKGQLDLSETTASSTSISTGASHTNTGDATDYVVSSVEYGGNRHFKAARGSVSASLAAGQIIGMPTAADAVQFGIPITGNPDFSPGTEIIETAVPDGITVGRVGDNSASTPDQDVTGSNIFRGGSSPTGSIEFVPTVYSLALVGSTFFQTGTEQNGLRLQLRTVAANNPSDPLYYASILRKMSTGTADSRILSDSIANSFSLSADRSTPLTCSMDFTGRVLVTDYKCDDGADGAAADTTSDIGRNYALHDCVATISEGVSTTQYVMPIDAFSLSGSMETGYTFFNQTTPQSIMTGPQSWEGSITVPLQGRGGFVTNIKMMKKLAQLGANGASPSGTVDPFHVGLYWEATPITTAIGAAATAGNGLPGSLAANRDLHIRLTCVPTDISVGGDAEASMTISFRCMNQMSSAGKRKTPAVSIDMRCDNANHIFGFTGTSANYALQDS